MNTKTIIVTITAILSMICIIVNGKEKTKTYNLLGKETALVNIIDDDGYVNLVNEPLLKISVVKSKSAKGTVLLLPGSDYTKINMAAQGSNIVKYLISLKYNVALLEYHVGEDSLIQDLALNEALTAYSLLKSKSGELKLNMNEIGVVGINAGAHIAARTVQRLKEKEQPDFTILLSPTYLDVRKKGTVIPEVIPPLTPRKLLALVYDDIDDELAYHTQEYVKTWIGYDGIAKFEVMERDAKNSLENVFERKIKPFLEIKSEDLYFEPNPATVPVEGYNKKRHAEKLKLIANNKYDLIMLGNSITNNFEKPQYHTVWNQFFAPRNAINLGYSAYRTENLIWNIENGELEGQSPKVLVLLIGTNNIDEENYPTRHTAGQLASGIEKIVNLVREKLPDTKIILLRAFPGCYGGPNPTSHRAILNRASEIVSKLHDGEHVFYCDVNHVFLNIDGTIKKDLMPDWLHPSPEGAKKWAQAMEPLLSELMEDESLDTEIPKNTAIVPVSKLENDSYNWWDRHNDVLSIKDSIDPEIVLIGNSITHFWGGEPKLKYNDGSPRIPNGPVAWDSTFKHHRVLNLGFGWDRTQNVLWRLDHGQLDGLHPKLVIIHIGTNNTSDTENARINTAPEIIEGIEAIVSSVSSKVPNAKIVLMAVFPREQSPDNPRRILINEINVLLKEFAKQNQIKIIDIGSEMLNPDGTLPKKNAGDFCHPTEKGYQIWGSAIINDINELLK